MAKTCPREGGHGTRHSNKTSSMKEWIPAFAGMTEGDSYGTRHSNKTSSMKEWIPAPTDIPDMLFPKCPDVKPGLRSFPDVYRDRRDRRD